MIEPKRNALRTLLFVVSCSSALAAASRHELPDKFTKYPFTVRSLTIGHPNHGYQIRAKKLRESDALKLIPASAEHSYGHPALVLMLQRTAKQIQRDVAGSVMLVGDLSREQGGPLYGHFSHQSGRDADVGFYARDSNGNSVVPSQFVAFDGQGRAKDRSGLIFDDYRNWLLVLSWARDERAGLSHIFVSSALRARLLRFGRSRSDFRRFVPEVAELMKQPENASSHDDHFHVRIACPEHQLGPCKNESRRR